MNGLSTEQNVHKSMNIVHNLATLAKRAFWVNPTLLSTNECRPHLSTYITHGAAKVGRGGASS